MFTPEDKQQFQSKGISVETVQQQIEYFKKGFPFTKIIKPATIGDGIQQLSEAEQQEAISDYEEKIAAYKVAKFVPASGAASRMFKALYAFVSDVEKSNKDQRKLLNDGHDLAKEVLDNLEKFAFYDDLKAELKAQGHSIDQLLERGDYATVLSTLLNENGLNYGNLPKGLLQFHEYENGTRTPVEEHLVEGAHYARSADGKVYLHFTVSPEHQALFEKLVEEIRPQYEQKFDVQFDISFSQQQPYTDTIAVDMENEPFREDDGSILFRPGGHGALIENLNDLDAAVIFIKNIDNVVPDSLKKTTYDWKKVLGGVLMNTQDRIFTLLRKLENTQAATSDTIAEAKSFLENELSTILTDDFDQKSELEKAEYLYKKLNRPIRVCGMVKNEGEPGGGPFWAKNADGTVSLQIVETAQVNTEDTEQQNLLKQSSHFNPVDIVCTLKNYKDKDFDLTQYVDHNAGFIAQKSKDGRELKALELPGLWNGSMADWNTVFVEVPIITFNPVKRVNDLLRKQHQ